VNTTAFPEPRRAHGILELEPSDTLHRYYIQRLVYSQGVGTLKWTRVPAHAESPWRGKTDLDLRAVAGTADYDSTWYTVEYRDGSLQIGVRPGMLDGGGTVLKPTHASPTEMYGHWEAYQGLAYHVDRRGTPIRDDGYFCATRSQ